MSLCAVSRILRASLYEERELALTLQQADRVRCADDFYDVLRQSATLASRFQDDILLHIWLLICQLPPPTMQMAHEHWLKVATMRKPRKPEIIYYVLEASKEEFQFIFIRTMAAYFASADGISLSFVAHELRVNDPFWIAAIELHLLSDCY